MAPATRNEDKAHNRELADLFHRMASCYRYLGPEQRFRAMAYDNASRTMGELKEDIAAYATDVKALDELHGIGESIGEKIMEYLKTGKVHTYEELKETVPEGILELMDISGFGPATVKVLQDRLGIHNREELISAIEAGRLKGLRGFGVRKVENLLRGLKLYKEAHSRMLLWEAQQAGNALVAEMLQLPGIHKAELAGSLRRRKETIGDIDIIACAAKSGWKGIIKKILALPEVGRVLSRGETRISFLLQKTNTQVDIRLVHDYEFGAALLYFTGSKEHNVKLRGWAKDRGWKLNEYGVFDVKTNRRLAGASEEEVYNLFGMQYIPPELREEKGEILQAQKKRLPRLITLKEVKGDLQMHSRWSDGAETIERIASYIDDAFPHYQYIVLTDHSRSQRIAHGLQPGDFLKQFSEIDRVNKKMGRKLVKKGVEVDILASGELDLPDDLLRQFEWVTASIHSQFTRDNTERLLKACEHPYVNCIGHPSGRIIGKREPYRVDWQRLFEKAAITGTALEINAQPERLDLKDDLVRGAIEQGVTLVISTDAHNLNHYDYMPLGVAVARRGWCAHKNVLNTSSWEVVERFRQRKAEKLRSALSLPGTVGT